MMFSDGSSADLGIYLWIFDLKSFTPLERVWKTVRSAGRPRVIFVVEIQRIRRREPVIIKTILISLMRSSSGLDLILSSHFMGVVCEGLLAWCEVLDHPHPALRGGASPSLSRFTGEGNVPKALGTLLLKIKVLEL